MGAPSRMLVSATALILLVVAMPAVAASPPPVPWVDPPITRILHTISESGPDRPCPEARQPTDSPMLDWWRQWWSAATSRRVARRIGPERPARTPFYLRSPMMSGFFGWGEPNECDEPQPRAQRNGPSLRVPAVPPAGTDSAALRPTPHMP